MEVDNITMDFVSKLPKVVTPVMTHLGRDRVMLKASPWKGDRHWQNEEAVNLYTYLNIFYFKGVAKGLEPLLTTTELPQD
ncbi:hypothetical protein Tco_0367182 [Tanacetum coccineum]